MQNFLLLLCFIFFNLTTIYAQKYISGEISQNTQWRGDVYINGDVVIPRGVTLSVEGGARVFFKPQTDAQNSGKDKKRAELIVNGVLQVRNGTLQNKVTFTSESTNPQMNDWYGIVIKNLYNKSLIENTVIEFGYKGITCYGSAPVIRSCEIQFNHNSGISCEVKAAPEISKCVLFGNGFAGINCELASNPIVSECTITQNNYGIIIFSRSAPDLGTKPETPGKSKGNNRIYNNFDYDIYNHADNTIYAQNNVWNTNSTGEIQQRIFDRTDNGAYGEVRFRPLYSPTRSRQFPTAIALSESQSQQAEKDSALLASAANPTAGNNPDSSKKIASVSMVDTTRKAPEIKSVISDRTLSSPSAPLLAANENPPANVETAETFPKIQEPVLEVFLDAGRREYVHRAQPVYPAIYLKTGTQGDVFIEVIINKQGRIDEYRVIKSDGELFTDSAVNALEKFVYKPGTVKGEPVKFKIVERFRFKQNNP
jgi:TonB family protein